LLPGCTNTNAAIVLSERLRKGIAAPQHVADFPAMVLWLSGNLLQKFSDVGMPGFDTPESFPWAVGRAILFAKRHQQKLPAVFAPLIA
jgi:hypothetical protein